VQQKQIQMPTKKPTPKQTLYAQPFQFREILFRWCPNWVRSHPEGQLAVHLIAQAFADNATWFFSQECKHFVVLCENLGLNPESVIREYRRTSRKYAVSIGMRYV
jgi:hypothetical protein